MSGREDDPEFAEFLEEFTERTPAEELAYESGRRAFMGRVDVNPFRKTNLRSAWAEGWRDESEKR